MQTERPPEVELIRKMSQKKGPVTITAYKAPPEYNEGAFIIKPAGKWLKAANRTPQAGMLFGKFWFEGELGILFADTNVGKSVLAVQIADSISRGRAIGNFEMNSQPAKVLYFDFELSDKQFEKRYIDPAGDNYRFNKSFLRAVFNPVANKQRKFSTYEDYISNELENALLTTRAKVLIVDNITCLRHGSHAAVGVLNLVRNLQSLKNKYKLSILVLAHTPKRNPVKPISRNDLQGSKMLINFCDSAFAIGESQSVPGMRYLKQIKQRSIHEEYGAANVCLCSIIKPGNFLQFEFGGNAHETEHLMHYTEQYRKNTETRIAELSKQGHSIRQIAVQLNLSVTMVFRTLKRLENRKEEDLLLNDVRVK